MAQRAKGLGSHVIVTETDPLRALEAVMDGYEVLAMDRAAKIGDIFCTATGDKSVIRREHMEQMKDGAILANTGHFNVEIDIPALRSLANETREARAFVEEFTLGDGRRLYLLGEGRLINLSAAEGHPALDVPAGFVDGPADDPDGGDGVIEPREIHHLRHGREAPDLFGRCIVERYVESYKISPDEWPVTQCALDTSRLEPPGARTDPEGHRHRGQCSGAAREDRARLMGRLPSHVDPGYADAVRQTRRGTGKRQPENRGRERQESGENDASL